MKRMNSTYAAERANAPRAPRDVQAGGTGPCRFPRLRARLASRAGFTLTELLATIAILVILGGAINAILPLAQRSYSSVMDNGNAEALLTTTADRLRDELSMATEILIEEPSTAEKAAGATNQISYLSGKTGSVARIANGKDLGASYASLGIVRQFYTPYAGEGETDPDPQALVPSLASIGMQTSYGNVTCTTDGIIEFSDIKVTKDGKTLTSLDSLKVRAV